MKTSKGFQLRDICGEKVIIAEGIENLNFSKLISLNESAAYIWTSVSQMTYFDEKTVTQLLLNEYDVTEDVALQDAKKLISEWKEQKIIEN